MNLLTNIWLQIASTPSLSFLQAGCPSRRPTNSVKALKARILYYTLFYVFLNLLLIFGGCFDVLQLRSTWLCSTFWTLCGRKEPAVLTSHVQELLWHRSIVLNRPSSGFISYCCSFRCFLLHSFVWLDSCTGSSDHVFIRILSQLPGIPLKNDPSDFWS